MKAFDIFFENIRMCHCPDSHFDQSDQLTWRLYLKPPLGVGNAALRFKKAVCKIYHKRNKYFF